MNVSIIIPAYNEESVIGNCLNSLSKQTYKDFEVIIIDDGSTDNTRDVIKKTCHLLPVTCRLLRQQHKGPGQARNLGAQKASGEILIFVDSDMTFDKDFIKRLVQPIEQGKNKGTWSREEYVSNPDNIWSRCWGINENWVSGRRHKLTYPDNQPVFRAILKSEFEKVGGFTPIGYTDDWTLAQKLGYEATNAPGAVFYHKNPDTLKEVFVQAKWIGKRKYKLGTVGKIIAMIRASLVASMAVGIAKSIVYLRPSFIIFKIVYDAGIFLGAFISLLTSKTSK